MKLFFIPAQINISSMKINTPDHKSSVSLGTNKIMNVSVAGKKNQGFGQQQADFSIVAIPIHKVNDYDVSDTYSEKRNR